MIRKTRILYLAHRIPYPPNKGDKIRSFNEVKHLSQSHTIDLICLADDPEDLKYQTKLEQFCSQVKIFPLNTLTAALRGGISLVMGRTISQGYFYSKQLQRVFDNWILKNDYDAIVCFSSPMAGYIFNSRLLSGLTNRPYLIMDFCDLDSDKWLQYSRESGFPKNILFKVEGKRLLEFEVAVNKVFDKSVFVSEKEADLFKTNCSSVKNVQVVTNGVDFDFFSPGPETMLADFSHPMLMFSGAMDYHANVDGVKWFCREILPIIRRAVPGVHFYITGSNPHPEVKKLGNKKDIFVTGFVDDIRTYYRAADICVIPLRMARGVQNKVLEAMATGKPVVTTSKAIQGINAVPDRDLISADTSDEFAGAVISLLKDTNKRKAFGRIARGFIKENHNWSKSLKQLGTGISI